MSATEELHLITVIAHSHKINIMYDVQSSWRSNAAIDWLESLKRGMSLGVENTKQALESLIGDVSNLLGQSM